MRKQNVIMTSKFSNNSNRNRPILILHKSWNNVLIFFYCLSNLKFVCSISLKNFFSAYFISKKPISDQMTTKKLIVHYEPNDDHPLRMELFRTKTPILFITFSLFTSPFPIQRSTRAIVSPSITMK